MSSASPKQGGLVAVTVRSDVPLASAVASSGGREFPLERDGEGRLFLGLVGVDFESAVGARELDLAVEGLCGDRHAARRRLDVRSGKFPMQKLKVDPGVRRAARERARPHRARTGRRSSASGASGDPSRRWTRPFAAPGRRSRARQLRRRGASSTASRARRTTASISRRPRGLRSCAPAPARVALADEPLLFGRHGHPRPRRRALHDRTSISRRST